jgi:hypothetical protein
MRTGSVELLDWVTTAELATLAQVDRTTAMRWRRGDRPAPHAVRRLLELELGGHVGPAAGPAWRGWYFDRDGLLHHPTWARMAIDAPELAAYLFLRHQGVTPRAIAASVELAGATPRG